jgi:hypothetical protein
MQDLFGKVRALLSALLCAALSCIFVLMIHPDSSTSWDASTVVDWTGTLFSPLALIVWSVVSGPRYRMQALRWTRRLILSHLILAVPFVLMALAVPFVLMAFVGFGFGKVGLGAYAYLSLLPIAVLVDVLLLVLGPGVSSGGDVLRIYRNCLMVLPAGALAMLFAWSFATVGLVVWQAEAVAAGRPYCIQVSKDAEGHYQPVTSLLDLSGLRLRAPVLWSVAGSPGGRFNHHAVLAVANGGDERLWENGEAFEQERWNWSHRRARFMPIGDREGHVRRVCAGRDHFARQLPIVPAP